MCSALQNMSSTGMTSPFRESTIPSRVPSRTMASHREEAGVVIAGLALSGNELGVDLITDLLRILRGNNRFHDLGPLVGLGSIRGLLAKMNVLHLPRTMRRAFVCICVGPIDQCGTLGHLALPVTIAGNSSVQRSRLVSLLLTHLVRNPRLVGVAGHDRLELFLLSGDVVEHGGGTIVAGAMIAPEGEVRRNHNQVPFHRCPDEGRDNTTPSMFGLRSG